MRRKRSRLRGQRNTPLVLVLMGCRGLEAHVETAAVETAAVAAGTRVAKPKLRRSLELTSLTDDLTRAGRKPTTEVLSFESVEATDDIAERLEVPEGTITARPRSSATTSMRQAATPSKSTCSPEGWSTSLSPHRARSSSTGSIRNERNLLRIRVLRRVRYPANFAPLRLHPTRETTSNALWLARDRAVADP